MHLKYQKVHNYFRSRNRTNHQLMIIFNLYRPFFYSNFYKYLPPPFKKPDSLSNASLNNAQYDAKVEYVLNTTKEFSMLLLVHTFHCISKKFGLHFFFSFFSSNCQERRHKNLSKFLFMQ